MTASLQEKVDTLETRTDSLETILGQFIASANKAMIRLETDTRNFRDEMKDFKDEVRADTKNLKDEMKDFKDEVRADTKNLKDEMKEFKNEMKGFKKEMDKRWGDLSNKMGTLVEDMVVPNISWITREYFGDEDFNFFAVRVEKKNVRNPGRKKEFDVIAVSDKNFFVNETKSNPRPEYPGEFADKLRQIQDYFPESEGKNIIPIFSSLYIPENIKKRLTRLGIYAMGMREGTMDLLNFEQLSERV